MTKILIGSFMLFMLLSCKSVFLRGTDLEDGGFKDDNTVSQGDRGGDGPNGDGNTPKDGSTSNPGGPNDNGDIPDPRDGDSDSPIKPPGQDGDDPNNRNRDDIILGCDRPLLIYLIFDSSGSMKCPPGFGNPFTCDKEDRAKVEHLQEAALRFIDIIKNHENDKIQVGLTMFDTEAREVTPIGRNFDDIDKEIKQIQLSNVRGPNTNIHDALMIGGDSMSSYLGNTPMLNAMILLSDGVHNVNKDNNPADTANKLRDRKEKIEINTIGFDVDGEGSQQLRDIAGSSGQYFEASEGRGIEKGLMSIIQSTCD